MTKNNEIIIKKVIFFYNLVLDSFYLFNLEKMVKFKNQLN